jgi:flagellar hook-associated protein 3 FlgL
MQIGNSQFYQTQVNRMNDLQTSIAQTQQQISTGKQVNLPSDDPTAYATIQTLKNKQSSLTQYGRNITIAQQSLNLEGTALTQTGSLLSRLKELTIQADNETNNTADRQAIAAEMTQIKDQLLSLANTTDAAGNYIFGGTKSQTQPFLKSTDGTRVDYKGDDGRQNVDIGDGISTAMSSNGQEVFMSIPVGSPPTQKNIFDMVQSAITDLNAGNAPSTGIDDFQAAIDHISIYQSINGARLDKTDTIQQSQQDQMTHLQETESSLEDTNVTAAATKLSQETLDLNASEASFSKIIGLSLFNYIK